MQENLVEFEGEFVSIIKVAGYSTYACNLLGFETVGLVLQR